MARLLFYTMYIITGDGGFGGKKNESTLEVDHFVSFFTGGDCQDQSCKPHPLKFPIPFPFHQDTAPTHSAEKKHECGKQL